VPARAAAQIRGARATPDGTFDAVLQLLRGSAACRLTRPLVQPVQQLRSRPGCPLPSRLCRPQKLDAADAPLGFAPGEAYQFDWSHEIVLINGTTVTVKVAHFDISVAKKTSPIWRSNRRLA
jgi:hypothetical protein